MNTIFVESNYQMICFNGFSFDLIPEYDNVFPRRRASDVIGFCGKTKVGKKERTAGPGIGALEGTLTDHKCSKQNQRTPSPEI